MQRGENDTMKEDVAKLQQEVGAVRAQAHDQGERFVEECMRLDADIRCEQGCACCSQCHLHAYGAVMHQADLSGMCCRAMQAAHPDLAFTWHLAEGRAMTGA